MLDHLRKLIGSRLDGPDDDALRTDRLRLERKTLRHARRQSGFARAARDAARAGVALAVVFGVTTLVVDLSTGVREDRAVGAASLRFIEATPMDAPVWISPRPVADLGEPPSFELDRGSQESHCEEWDPWLQSIDAVPSSGGHNLLLRAPREAPIVLLEFLVSVHQYNEPVSPTLIQCSYGAGGYSAHDGYVDLGDADSPLKVVAGEAEDERPNRFRIPPDQFRVDSGASEIMLLRFRGRPGFYAWSADAVMMIDQERYVQQLGSEDAPLLGYVPAVDGAVGVGTKNAPTVDWDLVACRWESPSYGVVDEDDSRRWSC